MKEPGGRRAIAEDVESGVIQTRRVAERTVGVEHQRAVRHAAHQHCRERIAVHVGIVRQDARDGNDERHVFAAEGLGAFVTPERQDGDFPGVRPQNLREL